MKKMILLCCASIAAICSLEADSEKVNGYTWLYRVKNNTANICSGQYRGLIFCAAISPSPQDAVTIPSMLGGYPVTSIGGKAFYDCIGLTSITLPDGVTSIGDHAFSGCYCLRSITVPDSVTSIGNGTFSGCFSLYSMTIPDGVTSIGAYAFYGCTRLTTVIIPDSVTYIGQGAFSNCRSLTNLSISGRVKDIGECTFEDCSSLTCITIPDSVTNIGKNAFHGCSSLTNATIPRTTKIDSDSFPPKCALMRTEIPKICVTSPEIHTEVPQQKELVRKKVARSVTPLSETNNVSEVFEHVKECLVIIKTGDSSGSGFIAEIDGKAWLITNEHVVRSGKPIVAMKLNGEKLTITSMQIAGTRDLVRMEVEEADVALPLADRTKIGMGKKIFVFGDSDGRGVFTTLSGEIIGVGPDQIEISAEIISGNSGSAIINEYGEVIGVATYAVNSSPKDWVKKDTRFSKVRRFGLLLNNYEWENVTLELYQKQSSAYNELLEFATIWAPNLCFKLTTGKGFHVESFNPSEFCILRQKLETIVSADEALVCEFEECKSFAKTFNNKYELQKAWNNAVATRKSILDKIGKCYTVRKDAIETGQKLANNSYAIERIEEDIKDIRDFFQYAVLELKNTYDDFHKLWRQYKYSAIPFMD